MLGNSLALYYQPVRVVEECTMLDVMSGGRPIASFRVGSFMDANFAYGAMPATLGDK